MQILLTDAVFSFDSIITAGGAAKYVEIMIAAVVIAMIVMFLFSTRIVGFIHKHPTLKMLALSFLVMIGLALVCEGFGIEIPKGYIYFSMAFSMLVSFFQMRMNRNIKPVDTHEHYQEGEDKLPKKVL